MTITEFETLVNRIVREMRNAAPDDTGNLKHNAVKFEFINPKEARIYVDERIAPYMCYTNEPWVSSYWKGAKNPNLYWFDMLAQKVRFLIEKYTNSESKQSHNAEEPLDFEEKAKEFQNKTGDYMPEDLWLHSEYITRADDVAALFAERIQMLGG